MREAGAGISRSHLRYLSAIPKYLSSIIMTKTGGHVGQTRTTQNMTPRTERGCVCVNPVLSPHEVISDAEVLQRHRVRTHAHSRNLSASVGIPYPFRTANKRYNTDIGKTSVKHRQNIISIFRFQCRFKSVRFNQ